MLLLRLSLTCLFCTAVHFAVAQDPFGGSDPFSGSDPLGGTTTDDPFISGGGMGSADTGFGDFGASRQLAPAAALATDADLRADDPNPVVRMLRASPPKTPERMARGLTWMVRIKRWDEIGWLLDQGGVQNWKLTQKATLARAAGSAIFLRIRSGAAELTDAQQQLVKEILKAPAQLARDPQRIDGWIDELASESPGERRLAQMRLQDASMVAIERLVVRLLDGDTKVAPEMLAQTAAEFGSDGIDALRAACLVGDPSRAARVFQALPHVPGRHFTAELGAGLASCVLPVDAQSDLAASLRAKHGGLPTTIAIHDYLETEFSNRLAEYQAVRVPSSGLSNLLWRLTPDRRSIQLVEAPADQLALERLAQLAVLRLQLKSVTNAGTIECGTVLLQRAYQVSPQLDANERDIQLSTALSPEQSTGDVYWQHVFAKAGDWQMHGAALRSLQTLAENGSSSRTTIDFLSKLLSDPRPMIRYSALKSLSAVDPQQSFAGAEKAIETALEMSHLGSGPHVLVIGLQAELRQAAQQQLQLQTGADVTSVNSARAALLALDGDDPIELIVIVDRVSDQSIYELLQRLRNTKKGQSLPIAVLTDRLYQYERTLIGETSGVFASVLSRNAEQMLRVVTKMLDSLDTEPMTATDRNEFGMVAGAFLARVAGDRDRYRFYPIGDWREQLVTTARGLASDQGAQLLSGLGTAESQRQLVRMTTSSGLPETDRLNAARAFASSVHRFGMRLAREDVTSSYAQYNRLGPTDPAAVKAIGTILDVIEASGTGR